MTTRSSTGLSMCFCFRVPRRRTRFRRGGCHANEIRHFLRLVLAFFLLLSTTLAIEFLSNISI